MSHPGTHAVAHAAPIAALPMIFRRAIAAARRKPAAPEVSTSASGAGCAGADWGDEVPPADSRMWHGDTEPRGFPVLGGRMLSEVRAERDAEAYPAAAYSGPEIWAVRPDGLIHVSEANGVEVCPSPLAWSMAADATTSFPVAADVVYQRADHDELDREFTDRPKRSLLERVRDGLLAA